MYFYCCSFVFNQASKHSSQTGFISRSMMM